MTGRRVHLPGWRLDKKTGKLVEIEKGSVSDKLKRKSSKRVRVAKRGS